MSNLREQEKTGALLEQTYALCGARPDRADLLAWAEEALALARELDAREAPARLRSVLEEICTLVEAHPASFAPAADWAEERVPLESGEHALILLDALAGAPERAALDEVEAVEAVSLDRLLESLPEEGIGAADEAIRGARTWSARVVELFRRAAASADTVRLAASPEDAQEEDYVLLGRLDEGELVLTRGGPSVWVDWYGSGAPRLTIDGEEIAPRPLPQGEGRRWPLGSKQPPLSLRLALGDSVLTLRIDADAD